MLVIKKEESIAENHIEMRENTNFESIAIVLCCDSNYLPFARLLVKDIAEFSPRYPIYIVVPNGTKTELITPFQHLVTFIQADLEPYLDFFHESSHISVSTYLRLFIPYLLPERITSFLYLDIDLLLISALDELFCVSQSLPFSLVPTGGKLSHHPMLFNIKEAFYGGVMLVNVSEWKREKITERCIDVAREFGPFPNQDNDLLLIVGNEVGIGRLPSKWNVMFYSKKVEDVSIVHFPGSEKPWNSYVGGGFRVLGGRDTEKLSLALNFPGGYLCQI